MIHYIKGIIAGQAPGMVYIENNGIAYELNVPEGTVHALPGSGETVTLYTAMLVREDDISLCGFCTEEELAMFRLLLTVTGIGSKAALAILSVLSVRDLKKAIIFEDINSICRANGVGKKTAQRLVLELKDKVGSMDDLPEGVDIKLVNTPNEPRDEAVAALVSLGFSRTEAMTALAGVSGDNLTTQDYIKIALRQKR